jgi:hypothetical protein
MSLHPVSLDLGALRGAFGVSYRPLNRSSAA